MKHLLLIIALFIFKSSFAQISFAPYKAIPTGSSPEVVAIGDMNNDGLNDVVLGLSFYFDPTNDFKLFIYYQNSSGSLNPPVKYSYSSLNSRVTSISIGDVNNDLLNDIVIGYGDSVGIFYQNSSRTLNPIVSYFSGGNVDCVKAGDLNNDGLNDIVASHQVDSYIRVFYQGLNSLTVKDYPKLPSTLAEVEIGDVTGDGLNDVIFMSGGGLDGIFVYSQDISGYLKIPVAYSNLNNLQGLNGMAIGDLNNDGRNDIAVSTDGNIPNCKMLMYFQDTITKLFKNPTLLTAYDIPDPVEIADLDCDGRNEIITLHSAWHKASFYQQDSSNNFNTYNSISLPNASHYEPQGLSIGDINNDGKKDIAIADTNNGLILLMNTSKPSKMTIKDTTTTIATVTTTPLNQDSYFKVSTNLNSTSSCLIIKKNKNYKVEKSFQVSTIRIDSIYVREGFLCISQNIDSIVFATSLRTDSVLTFIDTTYISTTIDTITNNPIVDFSLEKNINLYPIPTTDFVTIDLKNPCYKYFKNSEILIELFDTKGRKIITKNIASNQFPINMNLINYSPAIYFLTFTSDNSSFTRKIIKIN